MMKKFLNIDTVIEDVIDLGVWRGMLDRVAMKKLAVSIIRKLEIPSDHIDKIALIDIKDTKGILPDDLESITQLAFRDETPKKIRRTEIVEWTKPLFDGSGCELVIEKKCPKCHKEDTCKCKNPDVVYKVDRLWELSHPEFKYNHMKHYYRHGGLTNDNSAYLSSYHPEFVLMKPSTHDYFNADSHIPGCLNLNQKLMANCRVEYKLNYPTINVNKKEGTVLLAYLAARTDEEGYRMIPDLESVFDAVKWHIVEIMEYRAIGKATTQQEKNHHKSMYKDAQQSKLEAMRRAHEELVTPDFKTWWDFLQENHFKVLKDLNKEDYYGVKTPDVYGLQMDRLTRK